MSEDLSYFDRPGIGPQAVRLPFAADEALAAWDALRGRMIRERPSSFSRTEWAYLITFVGRSFLGRVLQETFGSPGPASGPVVGLLRPRGSVAVWLPSNVSLLGPLVLVLLSLSGSDVRMKAGSRADDLTTAFLEYALAHLPPGSFREYLERSVRIEAFDRSDPRSAEMARDAATRIVFGSDEAAREVERLEHPVASQGLYFTDRRSEAWVDPAGLDDDAIDDLIRVFAVYGAAGCTSPHRVVVIDGDRAGAEQLRDRLLARWDEVIKGRVAPHVASQVVLAEQWARVLGWDVGRAPDNAAAIATGGPDLELPRATHFLPVTWQPLSACLAGLPDNIQTIGHAGVVDPERWLGAIARTPVKRLVPLAQMHHFGPTWDGYDFFARLFERVEIRT